MLHGHIALCTYIIVITLMCVKERERPLMSSGLGSFVHKKIENKIKGLYFNINILFKIIFILNYAYLFGTCDMR